MIDAKDLGPLLAKQEITDVLHRYCYAMDTNDQELGRSVWHAEGTALYDGIYEGTGHGFVAGRGEHPAPPGSSHQLTNVLVEVDSDRATSQSCVTATIPSGDGSHFVMQGRYHDTWSRREGVWRMDHRHFVLDTSYRIAGA